MRSLPVKGGVPLHAWLIEPLPADVSTILHRAARADDVVHVAVMPDVHVSGDVCVGTVLATRNLVYPAAVGGDIGCGMAAVAFDCGADVIADEDVRTSLLEQVARTIPAMRHPRQRTAAAMPRELAETPLSDPRLEQIRRRDGAVQFATLGRGNHFVEFQADEEDRLWLMIHSGSRAMGPAIRDLHVYRSNAGGSRLIGLDAREPPGRDYLHDAAWARAYAAASRRAMIQAVVERMRALFDVRASPETLIECDHNHVARESHLGQDLWVHRKGAARAREGEIGIIPGSMGTFSFHTLGRGNALSLTSSSHGAGRAMSREVARRRIRASDLARQMAGTTFDHNLARRLIDEAPEAYKDVSTVMRAQRELVRVVRKLRPLLVYKAP